MTAQEKYREEYQQADSRLDNIKQVLAAHKRQAEEFPQSWAFVGDLGSVNEKLEEVYTFLALAQAM